MGNGHPIGAVVTTTAVAESFEHGPEFFSSFGGNPVSCAIGLAVLDVVRDEALQEHAAAVGDHLISNLQQLQDQYPAMADIRGSGLFIGVELLREDGGPATELAKKVKNRMREEFILISTDGPDDNVLKIKPPMAFSKADADIVSEKLDSVFAELL